MERARQGLLHIARGIAVCLVIGAVITVAVAWGLATFVGTKGSHHPSAGWIAHLTQRKSEYWAGWLYGTYERAGLFRVIATGNIRAPGEADSTQPVLPPRALCALRQVEQELQVTIEESGWLMWDSRGWPLPALSYQRRWSELDRMQASWEGGIALPPRREFTGYSPDQFRALPLTPLWGGFAVDVTTYGAAAWFFLYGFPLVRRAWRRRRGRCVGCGYSRKGLATEAVCPECGRAVELWRP